MNGIVLIKDERQRQILKEGYDTSHDDAETSNQLACAAAVYACHNESRDIINLWPWAMKYYKPDTTHTINGRIRELTKAGALICAEIDRLIRLKDKS